MFISNVCGQKELEALAEGSGGNPAVQGNFGMIRTEHSTGDYNIDNMALTPEDEKNPDLLVHSDV